MYLSELTLKGSVKIGELCYPPKNIEGIASRSVRLLTFELGEYVGFSGSCTLVKIGGKKYAITTRHQLSIPSGGKVGEYELNSVRISATHNGMLANILVDTCLYESSNPDQEYHDLLIFRVAEDSLQTTQEPFSFFPVYEIKNCFYISSFCIGYPTFANSMDYAAAHLKTVSAIRNCKRDRDYKSNSDYYDRFRDHDNSDTEDNFDYDGFSGGAVFSLFENADGYEVGLEGIIIRAGNKSIYTINANYLRQLV